MIYITDEMLTVMTCIEWPCDFIRAYVWELFLYLFVDGIMRAFVYIRPQVFDMVITSVLVKRDVFEVIGRELMNNWMVLCELHK